MGTAADRGPVEYPGGISFGVKIYPNPSKTGIFHLEFNQIKREDVINLRVYNLIGKEVVNETIQQEEGLFKTSFHLEALPKGMYILQITQGDNKLTRRISFI